MKHRAPSLRACCYVPQSRLKSSLEVFPWDVAYDLNKVASVGYPAVKITWFYGH